MCGSVFVCTCHVDMIVIYMYGYEFEHTLALTCLFVHELLYQRIQLNIDKTNKTAIDVTHFFVHFTLRKHATTSKPEKHTWKIQYLLLRNKMNIAGKLRIFIAMTD